MRGILCEDTTIKIIFNSSRRLDEAVNGVMEGVKGGGKRDRGNESRYEHQGRISGVSEQRDRHTLRYLCRENVGSFQRND